MRGMLYKDCANNEVSYFEDRRQKQPLPLKKKIKKKTEERSPDMKLVSEAEKEPLGICVYLLKN
jgi:hypothetical protein